MSKSANSDRLVLIINSLLSLPQGRSLQSSLECLSLTIEEVMHIRSVLTKAELECLLVNRELYELVSKGKVSIYTCTYCVHIVYTDLYI